MKVEFYRHSLTEEDIHAAAEAMRGVFISTGKLVGEFERRLASYTGNAHAVGLMSGSHALFLALKAHGIGAGDEVITTPMTFVATANAVVHAGATPVFVDVEADTGNMDAARIEAAVTPRTKAILVVHLYGLMCDMKAIRGIASRHNLIVIEDAAHCLEGSRDGVRPGNLSDAACFSFYATKNITSGEGGALVMRDAAKAAAAARMALHGMDRSAAKRFEGKFVHWDVEEPGFKANMTNIHAAMLTSQMARVDSMLSRREEICRRYAEAFSAVKGLAFPRGREGAVHARHLFTLWGDPERRDAVIQGLQDRGVGVTVNYRAVHRLAYYRRQYGYSHDAFPVAGRIGDSTLSLPLYPGLRDEEIAHVVASVKEVLA